MTTTLLTYGTNKYDSDASIEETEERPMRGRSGYNERIGSKTMKNSDEQETKILSFTLHFMTRLRRVAIEIHTREL